MKHLKSIIILVTLLTFSFTATLHAQEADKKKKGTEKGWDETKKGTKKGWSETKEYFKGDGKEEKKKKKDKDGKK